MNSAPVPPVILTPAARRLSVFVKVAGIGLLILLLHVPLIMTQGVLRERRGYQTQATNEIAGLWGRRQAVTGPVLAVPYAYRMLVERSRVVGGKAVQTTETELVATTAYFLPESLVVGGPVETEVRQRGIYGATVYTARLALTGEFRPDFAAADIAADRIDWEKAQVLFGVTDLRGVRAVTPLRLAGGREAAFESADGALLPLAARVEGVAAGARLEFAFDVTLLGSEQLQVVPVGKVTRVTLNSAWPDPSFAGAYLPAKRSVTARGFAAEWEISHFSRGFPQSWTDRSTDRGAMLGKIGAAGFGVAFARPVDNYRLAERAQKYGVLFFVLVFAVFFLFEMTAALRIHPLQYALVGAGLCLFFLGFLALSEFWATGWAYAAAAGACTALVSLYAWSFLRTGRRTLVIGGGLAVTYGCLYFVLQSQDYALVAGTAALFGALALVMFCTRRLDWYSLEMNAPAETSAGTR